MSFLIKWIKSLFYSIKVVKPKEVSKDKFSNAPWMVEAYKYIGTKEIVGFKHNPTVLKFHSVTELSATDDETAWCSSFVNFVLSESKYLYTKSALARSWVQKDFSNLTYPADEYQYQFGAIVVFKRGNSKWQGHVGFITDWDDKYIHTLGGNQNNKVCIMKYPIKDVIGIRWPKKG